MDWFHCAWISSLFPAHLLYTGSLALLVLLCTPLMVTVLIGKAGIPAKIQLFWLDSRRKVSLLMPYVWPKNCAELQLRAAGCISLMLFGRLTHIAHPLFNKWIVDGLAEPETFNYWLIVVAAIVQLLEENISMFHRQLWEPIDHNTRRELEVGLFEHLHALSLRWHLSRKTGKVMKIMDRGANSVVRIISWGLFDILPEAADIFFAILLIFTTFDGYFVLIMMVTMISYVACDFYMSRKKTELRSDKNEKTDESSNIASDSLLNYETVKYYGNEKYEVDRFRNAITDYQDADLRMMFSYMWIGLVQDSLIALGTLSGSIYVAYTIKTGNGMTVGDYVLVASYVAQICGPFSWLCRAHRIIKESFIDMESMFEVLNEEIEVRDSPDAVEYSPTEGRISVKNLSFEYIEGTKVLEDVSFDVGAGETVALVGPSGSGKSTIIRLLFRLFDANGGCISYDGKPVKDLKMATLRKCIGIVPQDTVLFNESIRYNIRFGRPGATDEEVEAAAKAAMMHDKILTLSEGYDTVVGERGLKLSGGEKQRVAIARTILKEPRFIFLDEATSSLDTHTERAIQRSLEELCAARTTVVVAHRLSTVVHATQLLVLNQGRIAERGSHAELLERGGIYARMWASQMGEDGEPREEPKESPPKKAPSVSDDEDSSDSD